MQKNIQIAKDIFIEDLGTGSSYVNFDREVKEVTDQMECNQPRTVIIAKEQYRVTNPATYSRIVDAVVKENFTDGKSEAAMRKGIVDSSDPDFVEFNDFVASIKAKCANEII